MLLISDKQGRITTPDEVDEFVCARVPALPSMDDESIQAVQQRRLWSYVTGMMMHDCNKACIEKRYNRRRGEEEDFCKKNFPKPYSDRTELSGKETYMRIILLAFFQKFATPITSDFNPSLMKLKKLKKQGTTKGKMNNDYSSSISFRRMILNAIGMRSDTGDFPRRVVLQSEHTYVHMDMLLKIAKQFLLGIMQPNLPKEAQQGRHCRGHGRQPSDPIQPFFAAQIWLSRQHRICLRAKSLQIHLQVSA
jgi:hypothetical protein